MATNRIDILDSALLRPGRIDRKIEFPPPAEQARADILKIHSRKMNLTRGINLKKIAEKMPGSSGAEVKVRPFGFPRSIRRLSVPRPACTLSAKDVCTSLRRTSKWQLPRS